MRAAVMEGNKPSCNSLLDQEEAHRRRLIQELKESDGQDKVVVKVLTNIQGNLKR